MEEHHQKQINQANGPFDIIYNYRNNKKSPDKPRRKVSACEKVRPVPQFTMRTRKMTADLQIKQDLSQDGAEYSEYQGILCPQPSMNFENSEQFLLKNEEELQKVIPLSPEMQNGIGHNLGDYSSNPTYNKLEQTLFGFKLQQCMESE